MPSLRGGKSLAAAFAKAWRGEFRQDLDTRRMATALISQIEGAVLLMKAHRRADPIEAGVGTLLKLMESR